MTPAPAHPPPDSANTLGLLTRADAGDPAAPGELLARHRPTLVAFVAAHLDPAVRARVDPSDVAQEALEEMARRFPDFLARRPMPFHVWVRRTAYEQVLKARRTHRATRRDVGREAPGLEAAAATLAWSLAVPGPTGADAAAANELAGRVAEVVRGLAETDREVLLLRHVDGLTHAEAALVLDLDPAAVRQRYGRALFRLQQTLRAAGVIGASDA